MHFEDEARLRIDAFKRELGDGEATMAAREMNV
jgi:hypothetical protein